MRYPTQYAGLKKAAQARVDSSAPAQIRGSWEHYKCVACDDRSTHMGYNTETGKVRCLRCGFTTVLFHRPQVQVQKVGVPILSGIFASSPTNKDDMDILDYMNGRGVPISRYGWGYGRGSYAGMPVIPVYDHEMKTVYYQARVINPHVGSPRYISAKGLKPRIDFGPVVSKDADPETLILVEGPFDMLRLRHSLSNKTWVCATFGMCMSNSILNDISKAQTLFKLKHVLVWFDAECSAKAKSDSAASMIRGMVGVHAVSVEWPATLYGNFGAEKVDQNNTSSERLTLIERKIKHVKCC